MQKTKKNSDSNFVYTDQKNLRNYWRVHECDSIDFFSRIFVNSKIGQLHLHIVELEQQRKKVVDVTCVMS